MKMPCSSQNLLSVVFALSLATAADAQFPDGLQTYFPFNGSFREVIHGGTVTAYGGIGFSAGAYGPGMACDGSDDCVVLADTSSPPVLAEMTVSLWAQPLADREWNTILTRNLTAEGDAPGAQYGMRLQYEAFQAWIVNTNLGQIFQPASGAFAAGHWYHFAMTYSETGNSFCVYADGELISSNSLTTEFSPRVPIQGPLNIGRDNRAWRYFDGCIDDVRFYTNALDAAAIRDLFESSTRPSIARFGLASNLCLLQCANLAVDLTNRLEYASTLSNGMDWAGIATDCVPACLTTAIEDQVQTTATSRFYRIEVIYP
jgi:hypothetical protein